MTTRLLIVLIIFTFSNSFAQTFEGKVVYANVYKSKMDNVPDEQLNAMLGTRQESFIKGGDYKASTNGTFFQWMLYINKDNKLYSKLSNSPSIFWNDGAVNPDEVIQAEINKGAMEILGHKCDELILTCKTGIQKYYYNSKFKMDPKLFEKHKFGNYSEVISRSNSIALKIIIENPQFILECTAVEIQAMTLESNLFVLPADSKLEKSPF